MITNEHPPNTGLLKPTPPPMPPPLPPKMPPPPEFKTKPVDPAKLKRLEQLRSRPRRRPDWTDMMKEVEEGKKLKHVVCNDRWVIELAERYLNSQRLLIKDGEFATQTVAPCTLYVKIKKGKQCRRLLMSVFLKER